MRDAKVAEGLDDDETLIIVLIDADIFRRQSPRSLFLPDEFAHASLGTHAAVQRAGRIE